jgi:hypothetical protein
VWHAIFLTAAGIKNGFSVMTREPLFGYTSGVVVVWCDANVGI